MTNHYLSLSSKLEGETNTRVERSRDPTTAVDTPAPVAAPVVVVANADLPPSKRGSAAWSSLGRDSGSDDYGGDISVNVEIEYGRDFPRPGVGNASALHSAMGKVAAFIR
eukprot:CAMPEP_0172610408 /NCGR_PEP_ID=MMETSP1068-20121228/30223_1 /TAXON_ID=35684 /ORGANISM="Pseudopedinella elastica, Strain CCMP716" /LENGTH=109 /DNA_ID=CAMNT_0013414111 /DNA_START=159 /DNA_END=484 /DNA_ORIENTATION=-